MSHHDTTTQDKDRVKGYTVTLEIQVEWCPEDFETEQEFQDFKVPNSTEDISEIILGTFTLSDLLDTNIKSVVHYE